MAKFHNFDLFLQCQPNTRGDGRELRDERDKKQGRHSKLVIDISSYEGQHSLFLWCLIFVAKTKYFEMLLLLKTIINCREMEPRTGGATVNQ